MRPNVFGLSLAVLFPTLAMQGMGQQPSPPSASSEAQQDSSVQPAKVSAKAIADAGALFQKACASCHFVPSDRDLTDVAWLGQIRETSWTSTPPKARVALVHWLVAETKKAPPEAARAPAGADANLGKGKADTVGAMAHAKVTSNIPLGTAVLAGPKGLVRLSWRKGQGEHYLVAGNYRLRNLRIIQKHEGRVWFTSATQAKGKALRVEAGAPLKLQFNSAIQFGGRAQWKKKGELFLGFSLRSAQGLGISIYRKGSRVPIGYEILDKSGKRIQAGKMNYGWGGGGWASVRLETDRVPVQVRFDVPHGPFALKGKLMAGIPKR